LSVQGVDFDVIQMRKPGIEPRPNKRANAGVPQNITLAVWPAHGSDLPDGQITRNHVQPHSQKYFASPFARNTFSDSSHSAPDKGAYRDRHERWVRDAVDAGCGARRARPDADGEVVWA
jgi:hypothetical protein